MPATHSPVHDVVRRARARLAKAACLASLYRRARWVAAVALAAAALRPLLWPLGEDDSLLAGALRAAALMAGGAALAALASLFLGLRARPTELEAARAIDAAAGHPELIASGWALREAGRGGAMVERACARADARAPAIDASALFPWPRLRPRSRAVGAGAALAVLALAVGAYDPVLVAALVSPPTEAERMAADLLAREARAVAARAQARPAERDLGPEVHSPDRPDRSPARARPHLAGGPRGGEGAPSGLGRRLEDLARRAAEAARAARRGDRELATRRLDELRRQGRGHGERAEGLGQALRRLAETLPVRPASASSASGARGRAGRRGDDPSAQLSLLARRTREGERGLGDDDERQRVLEQLSRAAEQLRRSPHADRASRERAAAAMESARASLSEGRHEQAARELEEAARAVERLQRARAEARAEADAVARLLEASGMLEQAVQMAMLGRRGHGADRGTRAPGAGGRRDGATGADGQAEMAALRAALAARLAAMGEAGGSPGAGPGGGATPRPSGEAGARLEARGDLAAPSQVREGERATAAIRGLGQRGEPTTEYRDVFPVYDSIAEEAMGDERIPAARRDAVRRYFEAIRPGGGEGET